jgi:hypothetical protein
MGELISPEAWCQQRWCRDGASEAHFPGDGCTCDPHGRTPVLEEPRPLEEPHALAEPRVVRLKAQAVRLRAFACRACGAASRDMVEQPALFFRCPDCAAADRWPPLHTGRA